MYVGMHDPTPRRLQRFWLLAVIALAVLAIATFAALYTLDHYMTGGAGGVRAGAASLPVPRRPVP
jgi:hypothetical protein